jgi:C4-dicarboxylate-specific signal transduction histidine kinase
VRQELESAILGCIEIWRLRHEKIELQQKLFNAERLATLGTLSAGLLHDVNHFLGVVTSNSSWLAERASLIEPVKKALAAGTLPDSSIDLGEGRNAKLSELAGELEAVIGDLSQDAKRLFDLARNAKGLTDQAAGAGDVREAVTRATGLLRRRIESEGATIETQIDDSLPPAALSTAGIMQALVNFLLNAVQAKRDGVKPMIRIGAKREAEGVSLTVRDNGAGMSRAVLAKVKQPFFTTKAAGVGTGLGLFTTQRLVQDAGGKLDIQSIENEGTTIAVWLPRAP